MGATVSFLKHDPPFSPDISFDDQQSFICQKLTEELPETDLEKQKKGKVIKFGWIEGVYVSTLLLTFPKKC